MGLKGRDGDRNNAVLARLLRALFQALATMTPRLLPA
jgi:hypothetical protein